MNQWWRLSILGLLLVFFCTGCAMAPEGFENQGRYMYMSKKSENTSLIVTHKFLKQEYGLNIQPHCGMLISRIGGRSAGWSGVLFTEVPDRMVSIKVGSVIAEGPSSAKISETMQITAEPHKVYVLSCDSEYAWLRKAKGSEYSSIEGYFNFEGHKYSLPLKSNL